MTRAKIRLAAGVLVVLLATVTASPVIRNDFAQDDVPLVGADARIHDLGNLRELVTAPFWPEGGSAGHHRPLMTLTLAAEWAMGGGAPVTFKVVSVTLHAAAALAVLLLALELLPIVWAAAAALLFAVHPVHVEAVATATSQSELLIGAGYALLTAWYLRLRRERILMWRERWFLGLAVMTACFLKETGVVLPALLGAVELFLLPPEPWRERLRHFRPTVLVQVLAVLIVVAIRGAVLGEFRGTFTAEGLEGLTMGGRALTMLGVVPEYLRLMLWPASLQADYSPQEIVGTMHWGSAQSLGALILVLVGTLAIRLRKSAPVVVFGFAWIAIGIAPVHNVLVPSGIVLAERTLFLPSIGAMLVVFGLLASIPPRGRWPEEGRVRWALGIIIAMVICLGASRSWSRYHVWRSNGALWTQTVIDAPDSYRAWGALGSLLSRPEHAAMAAQFIQRGVDLFPQPALMVNLAERYQLSNQCDRAIVVLAAALRRNESLSGRAIYLTCLTWEGEYDRAYREAMLGISSDHGYAFFRMWRRYLETLLQEKPSAHSRFAPPQFVAMLTSALQEPGARVLYAPLPELP